jgi:hypothetical protein
LPDFSWDDIPNDHKNTNLPQKYQMAIKNTKWHKKFTQIGDFGLKIYHLATLHKIYQMAVCNIANGHKILQLYTLQGQPKYTKIEIFGMKIHTIWQHCN